MNTITSIQHWDMLRNLIGNSHVARVHQESFIGEVIPITWTSGDNCSFFMILLALLQEKNFESEWGNDRQIMKRNLMGQKRFW